MFSMVISATESAVFVIVMFPVTSKFPALAFAEDVASAKAVAVFAVALTSPADAEKINACAMEFGVIVLEVSVPFSELSLSMTTTIGFSRFVVV